VRIAEIYTSLQGEGFLTGRPSLFVRTSGCNLRCWFCDTPYTSWQPEGEDWSVDEVVAEAERLRPEIVALPLLGETTVPRAIDLPHAVLTGGEPMLFAELIPLCEELRGRGWHITIETAGTLFLPVACDLMSISPKLASSTPSAELAGKWHARHEQARHQPEVIRGLIDRYDYQLKFVIDSPADLAEVEAWLARFPQVSRERVLLMPQGTDSAGLSSIAEWLQPYCQEHGYVFCPRRHIEWYGARRGT
jgi:7-carboxy-7-deazaguanine synthase